MLSTVFHRSFSLVSAWCVALAVLGTSLVQAAEFKPFLTLQLVGPNALITIAEKIGTVVDPNGSLGIKDGLQAAAPFKTLPGVNQTSTIGLAIQSNEDSPFGLDAVIVLPINNFSAFNIPGMEMQVAMLRAMLQLAGNNKFEFNSPFGSIVAYQKTGFLIIATEGADEFAATADPKKLFAELDGFTFGVHANLENLSVETIEKILGQVAMMMAMQGMEFDMDEVMNNDAMKIFDEISALTMGITLDARTLNLTTSTLTVPKKGSATAEKIQNIKSVKTKLGAFLHDTPKTVFSCSDVNYLTNSDIEGLRKAWELISESFLGGLLEAIEDKVDEQSVLLEAVEASCAYIEDVLDFFEENRLLDFAYSLDADGTLLTAMATKETEWIMESDEKLYRTLLDMFAGEDGKRIMDDKMKRNYETVAGYSLSCIPNVFEGMSESFPLPDAVGNIPLNLFWAVKKGEAIVWATGLDFAKTEQTVKAALQKTATAAQPKQTFVAGLKPLGELLLNKVYPMLEEVMGEENEEVKSILTTLSKADASAKIVVTTEYPGDAQLRKTVTDGKVFTTLETLLTPVVQAAKGAAQRMQCTNHLKHIVLAMHNYHDAFNGIVPLYTVDKEGKPLHSWRVLLLPFFEQTELYDQIRLDEPWDSAHNKQFHNVVVPQYSCPENPLCKPGAACTYSVIAGEACRPAVEENRPRDTFSRIVDGMGNTFAIVEVKQPFCWMDPTADVTLDELVKGINAENSRCGSFHEGGCNIGLFDGSVRFIPSNYPPAKLRALGSVNSGERVEW